MNPVADDRPVSRRRQRDSAKASLTGFHPLIREWFEATFEAPTAVQARAWPSILEGRSVLVSAPTGSGKTLTAFLGALDGLLSRRLAPGRVRVVYISPLRALNNDIRRNLLGPLEALTALFRESGEPAPEIGVATRSGDTPPDARRRMLRKPPEILITTPESLNILLTSESGLRLLGGVEVVILDEIHAVVGSKRGVHLMTAVERLEVEAGPLQRIGLSATVRPLDTVAGWLGGYVMAGEPGDRVHRPRLVETIEAGGEKRYDLEVRYPAGDLSERASEEESNDFWETMAAQCGSAIAARSSTLVFANSRRMTEKLTRYLNDAAGQVAVFSHHGSLSREVREAVEGRFKRGELDAIVATSSLELGIDIGDLDQVILLQSPRTVASAVQRVGRSGHRVGEVSRGMLLPTHGRDLLDAAVLVPALRRGDVEDLRPIEEPLDVLAQVVLSMTVRRAWIVGELLEVLRCTWAYRNLGRRQLDMVLEMLSGRYAETRIRELRARLTWDRVTDTVKARRGTERLLYLAGGTITDRGYFGLRHAETKAKLGELDEEFVWERSIGDTFCLGAQNWQIRRITHDDVLVLPARTGASLAPFWKADAQDRSAVFSERVARFLEEADRGLADADWVARLRGDRGLDSKACEGLLELLRAQKAAFGGRLPHRHRLIVERVRTPLGRSDDRNPTILHAFWGGTVHRPLALALRAHWEETRPGPLEILHDDDCLLLLTEIEGLEVVQLLEELAERDLEALLRRRLEQTGFFGSRFRANASTSLLIPRSGFRHRTPLWLQRERAKKLAEAVASAGDFPMLVETWRTCLQDEMELDVLRDRLGEIVAGDLTVEEAVTDRPSPFSANLVWAQTNQLMYESDRRESGPPVREDVLREVVFSQRDRPALAPELVDELRSKLQRSAKGYAPTTSEELRHGVGERAPVPEDDWIALLEAVDREAPGRMRELVAEIADRLCWWLPLGATVRSVVLREDLPRLVRTLGPADIWDLEIWDLDEAEGGRRLALPAEEDRDASAVALEWLASQVTVAPAKLRAVFGCSDDVLDGWLLGWEADRRVVLDVVVRGEPEPLVCDVQNLEILLRWSRRDARPRFDARPVEELARFLADHQGLTDRGDGVENLEEGLERLFCWSAPVGAWEEDILPARLDPFYPTWLDSLVQESELMWLGTGKRRTTFLFETDVPLVSEDLVGEGRSPEWLEDVLPLGASARTTREVIEDRAGDPEDAIEELWDVAWTGGISNDSWSTVRRATSEGFRSREDTSRARGRRRGWRRRPSGDLGRWFRLDGEAAGDALDEEQNRRDRCRILLDRYGILFRELLARELPSFRWGTCFRTLRRMELAGEVLAGQFFQGVPGLQFATPKAFRRLRDGLSLDAVWWLSAADPASVCGLGLEGLDDLPARRWGTRLVYHGTRLVLIVYQRGTTLEPRVPAEEPDVPRYLDVLKNLLGRRVRPVTSVRVERIGELEATHSPWIRPLEQHFRLTREGTAVRLWMRYRGERA